MRKFYFLLFIIILVLGCYDISDQKTIKIDNDLYATHFSGIDGYSISKKLSANGYRQIIGACVISFCQNKKLQYIVAKKINNFSSTDTLYLKFSNDMLDTLSISQYYILQSDCPNEVILFP
jgi:hypothetical protein